MENTGYLEYIIPIIFFAIWVVGRIFGRKEAKDDLSSDSSEDTEVYPYPLKEQFDKVSESVEHSIERMQEKTIAFKRETEQRRSREEEIIETNLNFPVKSDRGNEQRSALLGLLKDANSLKKAFLVSEILNVPVALRKNENRIFR